MSALGSFMHENFGALAGGLSSALSLGGSLIGGNQQNQAALDRQNSANEFSAQQFATRYQTTVKDLQAAGLNPMLAYGATPNAPSSTTPAPVQNALGGAIESYQKNKAVSAQAALQEEQINQSKSQTTLNSAQAAKAVAEAEVSKEQAELLRKQQPKTEQEQKTSNAMMETLMQQGATSAAQAKHYGALIENLAQNNQNLKEELKRIQQGNALNKSESEIADKYPTYYYLFHKLLPTISGSVSNFNAKPR